MVPAPLFRRWEQQHEAAERSRMMAEERTRQRVELAKARVVAAIRMVETVARLEYGPMT